MSKILITGSGGLVGSATVKKFCELGFDVVGIDNDSRKTFFGELGSTAAQSEALQREYSNFTSLSIDIRDIERLDEAIEDLSNELVAVIHCAAQPSHDWAAKDPLTDFSINATGTVGLIELVRRKTPETSFIFMSTNKVYGDSPNQIEFEETHSRWTPPQDSRWFTGFDETLSIDQSTHSVFGVSKASADLWVQEYGRYFGMNTAVFRGGCLTGPNHAGVELHGFLSYLVKCAVHGRPYTVFGHKAKQVRDNIHTEDLVDAFWEYLQDPQPGEVFNIGGGKYANVSMLEAIEVIEGLSGKRLEWSLAANSRVGDHRWYVSDLRRLERRFPSWRVRRGIEDILKEMVAHEMKAS